MGYIHTFGDKLEALLVARGVAKSDREEIIAYVKHAVLESYNNGRAALRRGGKPTNRRPSQEK